MDCFQDFCLACDKQCEGSYCSQSCRLADLEKAPTSGSISPLTPGSSWESTQSGYVLTPAYNFTERDEKRLSTSSASSSASHQLTPSSSRTSLSSTSSSSPSGTGISKQARAALQDYFSSFDQTRAAKRRSSLR